MAHQRRRKCTDVVQWFGRVGRNFILLLWWAHAILGSIPWSSVDFFRDISHAKVAGGSQRADGCIPRWPVFNSRLLLRESASTVVCFYIRGANELICFPNVLICFEA